VLKSVPVLFVKCRWVFHQMPNFGDGFVCLLGSRWLFVLRYDGGLATVNGNVNESGDADLKA
jgi:hypothetical protein